MLKKALILLGLGLTALPVGAQPEAVQQLKNTRECVNCNLSGADLRGLNLIGVNLSGANLSGAKLGSDQHLGRGEGYVQEEADTLARTSVPQRLRKWNEVIVMHPDQVVVLEQAGKRGGEPLVRLSIALEEWRLEAREVEPVVEDRKSVV